MLQTRMNVPFVLIDFTLLNGKKDIQELRQNVSMGIQEFRYS